MAKVTLDYGAIERGLNAALSDFARGQNAAYLAAIADPLYGWPGVTKRRSGETAGRIRNIVDTGEFRNSQSYSVSGLEAVWRWDVDHAAIIFFGYTTSAGNSYPPRNWIKAAHQQSPPDEALGRACRAIFT